MKLVVSIPAFNEADTIEKTVLSIPKEILGISKVEVLVINDGSSDNTVDLALNAGADKIISHSRNLGVGAAFMTGIRNAITMGADIVVTIDADSQFDSSEIKKIIVPILNRQADVVIGSRFLKYEPKNYPRIKKIGNKIFSKIVSWIVGQKFTDSQTGFRAYSRNALLGISVVNEFSYTQEVLIDLKMKRFNITEIPVNVSYDEKRKSRVVKNIFSYSVNSLSIIVKSLVFHKPVLVFGLLGTTLFFGGILAKVLTINKIFLVSTGLSTGFIIFGIVSVMLGLFASMVFKRQAFSEKDLRHYINEFKNNPKE